MYRILTAIAALGVIWLLPSPAQADAEVGPIERDIRALASPTFEGRGIDGPGANSAAGYIVARLIDAGAQPAAPESFLEHVLLRSHANNGVSSTLGLGNENAASGRDFSFSGAVTQPLEMRTDAVIVFWSSQIASSSDFAEVPDLKDRIVVFANLGDASAPPPPSVLELFERALAARPAMLFSAMEGLSADLQAREEIEADDPSLSEGPAWRYTLAGEAPALSGAIDRGWLLDALPNLARADLNGVLTINDATFTVSLEDYRSREHDTYNVVASIPGRNADLQPILFSAHYDHLGKKGETYYPGADDNASGVAVLLDLARRLAERPAERSVEFAFFTGEEHGLLGSQAFAERHGAHLTKFAYLVNIDAIGRAAADNPANTMKIFQLGLECLPQAKASFDDAFSQSNLQLIAFEDFPMLAPMAASCNLLATGQGGAPSDQLALAAKGLKGVILHGGLTEDYHQPTDTPEKVLYPRLELLSEALYRMVSHSSQSAQ